jgi:parvulin-like peptidyl-prolyl isomerase
MTTLSFRIFCFMLLGATPALFPVVAADDSVGVSLVPPEQKAGVEPASHAPGADQSRVIATGPSMEPVVMARIGEVNITVEEFMNFLSKNPQRVREAMTVAGKAALLRTAIENRLLLAAMRQEGFINEDTKPEQYQLAYEKLARAKFPPPSVPSEKALRDYYEDYKEDFGIPASVRLTQIQFRIPEQATAEDKAAARTRAEEAYRRIEAGEAFAEVAGELTENKRARPYKGDVGYVAMKSNDWLVKALDGIAVGQHTGILESPAGYDILMVTDISEAVYTPFEGAREAVTKRMQSEAQEAAKSAYVKELASLIEITIELDELKDAYPNGIFP